MYFDILIFGEDSVEHDKNLEKVLDRIEKNWIVYRIKKCIFAKNKVDFLGYQLDGNGLHVAPNKISAIMRIAKPTTVTELKSLLGIVNYYAKFVKNFATIAAPLFKLLRKNVKFQWSREYKAFKKIKKAKH